MRQRSPAPSSASSGLVPMADMLSNTVGIMLFILAFTVLQTGGVLIPKRLPVERETDERAIYYVCRNERLIPLNTDLSDRLTDGLGALTVDTLTEWNTKLRRTQAEDEFFSVTPHGEAKYQETLKSGIHLDLVAEYQSKDGVGDTMDSLDLHESLFRQRLDGLLAPDQFVYFFVYPDSIALFRKARECAAICFGVGSGWSLVPAGEPIRITVTGSGGIRPRKQ